MQVNDDNGKDDARQTTDDAPYIPASRSLPEITIKAVALGVFLSILLAGANAYLGLLAGMTVSASIPAAVISMAVLRLFRTSNILENNIVQTAASAGESLAAGVIFTLPALVLLGAWEDFNYWETTIIAGLGGLLGVIFTIPLRRALIVEQPLKFPEGIATAEVLKVGDTGGAGIKQLILGGLIGAIISLGAVGMKLWAGTAAYATRVGGSILFFGSELKPALVAVGYIVGINIAVLVFLGGAINWFVAIPVYAGSTDWPVYQSATEIENITAEDPEAAWRLFEAPSAETIGEPIDALDWANQLWSKKTRYLGVGAMVIGGLWALIRLWKSLVAGITSSVRAYKELKQNKGAVARTDRDTPIQFVGIALLVSVIPLYFVFGHATHDALVAAVMAIVMLVAGFLFSAVASYMAGLVGSSNNPISGVTIATLLTSALLLLALGVDSTIGPAAAIFIGGVVASSAAIGGDNMQDLKAGRLVGATPYKQQIIQSVGVLAGALTIAPTLSLLLHAYGIGAATPEKLHPLRAPQASLMESVARGVFEMNLPWTMVVIGMAIAAAVIIFDLFLEKTKSRFRAPVLAVAVGIYLPLELSVPILVGGLISWAAHRFHMRRVAGEADGEMRSSLMEAKKHGERTGLLMAAGLITGEAIVGILLAIPIVLTGDENVLAVFRSEGFVPPAWPAIALLLVVCAVMWRVATKPGRQTTG